MKKVLFTASNDTHIRHFHLPYLKAFRDKGYEVHVACGGNTETLTGCADRVLRLPFRKSMGAPENFAAASQLRKLIQTEGYSLITTHTSLAAFFTRLACKGLKNRPPLVNVAHGYLFDDDTPFYRKRILLDAERLTAPETDLLLTMNEYDTMMAKRYKLGRRQARIPGIGVDFSRLERDSTVSRLERISASSPTKDSAFSTEEEITFSRSEKDSAPGSERDSTLSRLEADSKLSRSERDFALSPEGDSTISRQERDSAISPDGGSTLSRAALGLTEDAFVLLYAAEFSKRKSQETLIRAMKFVPISAILVLAGDGKELTACRELVRSLELSRRVMFLGYRRDMASLYILADAVVCPSRMEGLPFHVMEAMYMGKPVAASAVKGHTDLIEHGRTGLLFPYGDAKSCARQIRTLMSSEKLRQRLSAAAKEQTEAYALERVLPSVMEQYEYLLCSENSGT